MCDKCDKTNEKLNIRKNSCSVFRHIETDRWFVLANTELYVHVCCELPHRTSCLVSHGRPYLFMLCADSAK